jgi:hypothetical protein
MTRDGGFYPLPTSSNSCVDRLWNFEVTWFEFIGSIILKDPEGDQRGGEWEPIKILLENLAYTLNPSRNPSLLARPRPSSYRLAISPRNRARNRTRNLEWC